MNTGKAIRKRRREISMTQFELIRKAGISQTYLSQIETGHKKATISTLEKIAKALDLKSVETLLLLSVDREDVPDDRKVIYDALEKPLKALIEEIFMPKDRFN